VTPYITRMHRVTINILCLVTHLVTELFRDAIPHTLMWPVLVEKVFLFIEYELESVQPQDNQMVQAFFTQTSNPMLSNGWRWELRTEFERAQGLCSSV
jgi:hypothetical protein